MIDLQRSARGQKSARQSLREASWLRVQVFLSAQVYRVGVSQRRKDAWYGTAHLQDRRTVVWRSVRTRFVIRVVGQSVPQKHQEGAASNASPSITKRLYTVIVKLLLSCTRSVTFPPRILRVKNEHLCDNNLDYNQGKRAARHLYRNCLWDKQTSRDRRGHHREIPDEIPHPRFLSAHFTSWPLLSLYTCSAMNKCSVP